MGSVSPGKNPFTTVGGAHYSGQIITTSHDLTPNGGLVREIPLFQLNIGWWNIIIWPDYWSCIKQPEIKRTHPVQNKPVVTLGSISKPSKGTTLPSINHWRLKMGVSPIWVSFHLVGDVPLNYDFLGQRGCWALLCTLFLQFHEVSTKKALEQFPPVPLICSWVLVGWAQENTMKLYENVLGGIMYDVSMMVFWGARWWSMVEISVKVGPVGGPVIRNNPVKPIYFRPFIGIVSLHL